MSCFVCGIMKIQLNRFPNKFFFLRFFSTSLLKTLWKKEKLLVTSNFSFSHSVFHPFGELSAFFIIFKIVVCILFQFGRVQILSFGKEFNPDQFCQCMRSFIVVGAYRCFLSVGFISYVPWTAAVA